MTMSEVKRHPRWYFGGVASGAAAFFTHPMDLVKVHLQTQQKAELGLLQMGVRVVKTEGYRGLWNGYTASLLRQMTYSLTRFGMYEAIKKQREQNGRSMPFYEKVMSAAISGGVGGVVGTPGDMVNVRMQNDMKVAKELRRNYKHALDGVYRVATEEGIQKCFSGATMASSRAVFMTVGQLSFYDQIKQTLISSGYFKDNKVTHFTSSFAAGTIATCLTQPLDVMKTRFMNAKPGQYKNLLSCAGDIYKTGLGGFYKGFVPAWVRLLPQTVLTFMFFEQLKIYFGYDEPVSQ